MTRTEQNPSTDSENQTINSTSRTATEHYSIKTSENRERETRAPRSNDSHLGITIRGGGPASGRPEPALRTVDLANTLTKIVVMGGCSPWC